MAFEERLALLCEKAQKDYDEYMGYIYRLHGTGIAKEAMKIVVMEEMLSQIKNGQFEHPFDVELLLYHDHPLLAAYGQWEQSEFGIMTAVNENVNEFLVKTRNQLAEMQGRYDTLAPCEQERIMEYHNREIAVFDYLQNKEIREKNMAELMEEIDQDYKGCQEYIKYSLDMAGEHPTDFADTMQTVYEYMKSYDGYTDEQLEALNSLPNPLASVQIAFKELVQDGPADEKTIERAIAMVVQMEQAFQREHGAEQAQGRDDDGLDR